jgi:hypothetical protein
MNNEVIVFTGQKEKDWLITLLRERPVEILFTKKDGSDRLMKCTLQEAKIPSENAPKGAERAKSDESIAVFDLEKQDWRSFRFDSVKNIEFTLGE